MIDTAATRIWTLRAAYTGLTLAVIVLSLVPVGPGYLRLPGPDLMICLTAAITLRRPELTPLPLVAALFLLADFVLDRPPGLWAALAVGMVHVLRAQVIRVRELPFLSEWGIFTLTFAGAVLAERVLLFATFSPVQPLPPVLAFAAITALIYPAVVLFTNLGLRLRKVAPGETDMLGHRT